MMKVNTQHYAKAAFLMALLFVVRASARGQEANKPCPDQTAVTAAVAPTYPLIALSSHTSGELVVEVKIKWDGSVTSVQAISGSPVLAGGSNHVARLWKFAAAADRTGIRTARLTFVYRLVPKDTPTDQLLPVFKPPYRVEITHIVPDDKSFPATINHGRRWLKSDRTRIRNQAFKSDRQ